MVGSVLRLRICLNIVSEQKENREGVWLEITWDCRMSRGTGTLAEAVRERFN